MWSFEGILGQRISISNRPNVQNSLFSPPEDRVLVLDLWIDLFPVCVDRLGNVHCCKERRHQDPS